MSRREIKGPLNPDRIIDPKSIPKVDPKSRGDLPHIHKTGCTYFVTFCLVDAVPAHVMRRINVEESSDPSEIARLFDIDPGHGSCILGAPDAANIIESAMLHFQGDRYALSAWCVMPNHVHAVVTPFSSFGLSKILHSWKSFSAHAINKALKRTGRLWEKESFDHLVRNENAFQRFVVYTEENPVVAGLCRSPDEWPFGSAKFQSRGE